MRSAGHAAQLDLDEGNLSKHLETHYNGKLPADWDSPCEQVGIIDWCKFQHNIVSDEWGPGSVFENRFCEPDPEADEEERTRQKYDTCKTVPQELAPIKGKGGVRYHALFASPENYFNGMEKEHSS